MNRRTGTFEQFKEHTLAVVRGEREIDPNEPKIWREQVAGGKGQEAPEKSASADTESSDYIHSTLRERIVEHVFVGEALRKLWQLKVRDVEVLRSEFDVGGYDLVMSYRKIVRHIQFKAVTENSKTSNVTVSVKLMEKPAGCVIWIGVNPKLELISFRWFGDEPNRPLPDITNLKPAMQVRANAKGVKGERSNYRIIPKGRFKKLETLDQVLDRLFGGLR